MRRLLAAVPLALVVVALAPPATPATAQVEMCQGQPATIVVDGSIGGSGTDGDDVIVVRPGTSASYVSVDGGGGDDLICVSGSGKQSSFTGVEGGDGHDSVEVRFGAGAQRVEILTAEDLDVELGGGFDSVLLSEDYGTGRIDGGPGDAILNVTANRIDLDLKAKKLNVDDGAGRYRVTHVRRVSASARRMVIDGNDKDNGFRVEGCHVTIRGGRGGDKIMMTRMYRTECSAPRVRLLGQEGDDRLDGSASDDVLLGGPGFDRADGATGRDRCVAEKEVGCER